MSQKPWLHRWHLSPTRKRRALTQLFIRSDNDFSTFYLNRKRFRVTQLFEVVCTHSMAAYQCCRSKGWMSCEFHMVFLCNHMLSLQSVLFHRKIRFLYFIEPFRSFQQMNPLQKCCSKTTAFSICQKFGILFSFILEIKNIFF